MSAPEQGRNILHSPRSNIKTLNRNVLQQCFSIKNAPDNEDDENGYTEIEL